jgi:hypothetical protein
MQFGESKQNPMKLIELLDKLELLDDSFTIYADPIPEWTETSAAIACLGLEDGSLPEAIEAAGLKYLLEVNLAKEVLEVWRAWREGKEPSPTEKCQAIIYYAKHDSYLPP